MVRCIHTGGHPLCSTRFGLNTLGPDRCPGLWPSTTEADISGLKNKWWLYFKRPAPENGAGNVTPTLLQDLSFYVFNILQSSAYF